MKVRQWVFSAVFIVTALTSCTGPATADTANRLFEMLSNKCLQRSQLRPCARPFRAHITPNTVRKLCVAVRAQNSGSPVEGAINWLTVALKNSPINEGKKALAKAQAGDYDQKAIRAKIEGYIKENKVVVFSWSGCPFCKNAKALLKDVGADFTALELDTMGQEGKAIRAELAQMTDRTSVPNIWIAGQNVGGCNDGPGVMTLHKQGQLVPMLEAAGALA